jgi:hypothetical protein
MAYEKKYQKPGNTKRNTLPTNGVELMARSRELRSIRQFRLLGTPDHG